MSKKDIRKEQIALLRFENQLVAMAETLAAGSIVAEETDAKTGTAAGSAAYAEMKAALQNLANVTSNVHDSLMEKALTSDLRFVKFGEETSLKRDPIKGRVSETVSSKLPGDVRDPIKGRVSQSVSSKLNADTRDPIKGRVSQTVSSKLNADTRDPIKGRVSQTVSAKLNADTRDPIKGRVSQTVSAKLNADTRDPIKGRVSEVVSSKIYTT